MYERIAPEQHDTLDGVPEPSENLQLFGHEAVVAQLTAAHRAGKLPHALVFAGPRGIGKATTGIPAGALSAVASVARRGADRFRAARIRPRRSTGRWRAARIPRCCI